MRGADDAVYLASLAVLL